MNCDQARDLLDDRRAGTLPAAVERDLDRHLADCAECRSDWEALAMVGPPTGQLSREIQPTRDLWAGIKPRLKRRGATLAPQGWRLAAAAVLLVAASSATTWFLVRDAGPRAAEAPRLEADYARTALELTDLYGRVQTSLAPETRAVLERNLAVIERALGEARTALRNDPSNQALAAIVLTAYRRKIEFLERATALDREL